MKNVLVFGGTKEGRILADYMEERKINGIVSVATQYGKDILPKYKYCKIHCGRMDEKEMDEFCRKNHVSLIVDATHPYAVEVSLNIKNVSQLNNIQYIRVLREEGKRAEGILYFKDISEVIDYINLHPKTAFISTGSKELKEFRKVNNYSKLLYVRVLPIDKIIRECVNLGYRCENIIGEKGPFSVEKNIEHLNWSGAKYMVTKDTGKEGGFLEKIEASIKCGVIPLVIERPVNEDGVTIEEAEKIIGQVSSNVRGKRL